MDLKQFKADQYREYPIEELDLVVKLRKPNGVRLLNNYDLQPGAMAKMKKMAAAGAGHDEIKAAFIQFAQDDQIAMLACMVCDSAVSPHFYLDETEAMKDDNGLWIYHLPEKHLTDIGIFLAEWLGLSKEDTGVVAPFREPDDDGVSFPETEAVPDRDSA